MINMGTYKIILGTFALALVMSIIPNIVNAAGPALPSLGVAGNFSILAETGISTGGASVTGNLGLSPAAASYITGFGSLPLTNAATGEYATSPLVTGNIYAASMVGSGTGSGKTPAMLTTAVNNMYTAYTDAQGITAPAPVINSGAGELAGLTLTPGVYKFSESLVQISSGGTLTLNCGGNSSSTYIFQIPDALTLGTGAAVSLSGGCQPQNIYWAVGTQVTMGTTSTLPGIVLAGTSIAINSGAVLTGKALAQAAVNLVGTTGSGVTGVTMTAPVTTTNTTSTTNTTTISPGAPRTFYVNFADNINNLVIPGNSTAPVLTTYIKSKVFGGSAVKQQFYQAQLPVSLKLTTNQVINFSYSCTFVDNSTSYNFTNDIYGIGVNANCNKNYTAYGGAFAGVYTTAPTTRSIAALGTKPVLPVVIAFPANTIITPSPTSPVIKVPTNATAIKTLPFPWLGAGYYEIPLNGTNMKSTGMTPGVAYWVANYNFIASVNKWLSS
jgi:hypothetical protein